MGEILTGYYQNPKKGLKCAGPRKAAAIDLASNNTEQKERKNRGHRGLLSWLPRFTQGQGPHSAQLLRLFSFVSSAQLLGGVWLYDPWTVACQAPQSMGTLGKTSGVGCSSLLQGIFLTQGSSSCLVSHIGRGNILPLSHLGILGIPF